jgi:hypothetical protein
MTKIFYDHLILFEEIKIELDKHDLTLSEKRDMIRIIDETFHQEIVETILDNLPVEHHKHFLDQFIRAPHEKRILEFLKEYSVTDIEEEIRKKAAKVRKEISHEIRNAGRKSTVSTIKTKLGETDK